MDDQTTIVRPAIGQARRLVLVTETWPPEINGVAMTLSRLVQGISDLGWQVRLVRPRQKSDGEDSAGHMLVPGLPIPGYSGLRFGMPMVEKLRQAWKKDRPDVVHIATEGPLGWAALKVARNMGIPVTSSFHTNFHRYCKHYGMSWLRGVVTRHLRQFHNQSALTMVPNDTLRQMLLQENYRNVAVLGRGVDSSLFSPARRSPALRAEWGLAPYDLAVIYVGRLAAEKNLALVIKAFDAIQKVNPTARMVWVGSGPEARKLMRRYPQHIFCGPKSGEELAEHYASGDVFLFPSMTETFGNVLTEAMASGLAVVAYDYAAAEIFIQPGVNGVRVPFGDSAAFMQAATALVADPALLQQYGRAAASAVAQCSWQSVCRLFDGYLQAQIPAQSVPEDVASPSLTPQI